MITNGHNVSRTEPCPICGKPDLCFFKASDNGELIYCGRVCESTVVSGGQVYLYQKTTNGFPTFYVYEEEQQRLRAREKWIEEQKKKGNLNPNYKYGKRVAAPAMDNVKKRVEYTVVEPIQVADPDRLHEVYSCFLDLCILEKCDEYILREEWTNPDFPDDQIFDNLINLYPIKSIPPEDHARIESGVRLKNLFRKKIMEELVKRVGEPIGVPGFYQMPNGRWTFYLLSGIAFPVYDSMHRIIRIRIKDAYPNVAGTFEGKDGDFSFNHHDGTWYFCPIIISKDANGIEKKSYDYQNKVAVYNERLGIRKIQMGKNMIPKGKVNGKYKNFSSYSGKKNEEKKTIENKFLNGCQSGSKISLYSKKNDDYTVVYFTEGEKKGMVSNLCLNAPCVTFPGVGTFGKIFDKEEGKESSMFNYLVSKGMKLAVIVFDADKVNNQMVLNGEKTAISLLKDTGVAVALGEWNIHMGKGFDDILIKHILPKYIPVNM